MPEILISSADSSVAKKVIVENDSLEDVPDLSDISQNDSIKLRNIQEALNLLLTSQEASEQPAENVVTKSEANPTFTSKTKQTLTLKANIGKETASQFFSRTQPDKHPLIVLKESLGRHARLAFIVFFPFPDIFIITGVIKAVIGFSILYSLHPEMGKSFLRFLKHVVSLAGEIGGSHKEITTRWLKQSTAEARKSWKTIKKEVAKEHTENKENTLFRMQYRFLPDNVKAKFEEQHKLDPSQQSYEYFRDEVKQYNEKQAIALMVAELEREPEKKEAKKSIIRRVFTTFPDANPIDIVGLFAISLEHSEEDIYRLHDRFPHATVTQIKEILIGSHANKKIEKKLWNLYENEYGNSAQEAFDKLCYKATKTNETRVLKMMIINYAKSAVSYRMGSTFIAGLAAKVLGEFLSLQATVFLAGSLYITLSQFYRRYSRSLAKARKTYSQL